MQNNVDEFMGAIQAATTAQAAASALEHAMQCARDRASSVEHLVGEAKAAADAVHVALATTHADDLTHRREVAKAVRDAARCGGNALQGVAVMFAAVDSLCDREQLERLMAKQREANAQCEANA